MTDKLSSSNATQATEYGWSTESCTFQSIFVMLESAVKFQPTYGDPPHKVLKAKDVQGWFATACIWKAALEFPSNYSGAHPGLSRSERKQSAAIYIVYTDVWKMTSFSLR